MWHNILQGSKFISNLYNDVPQLKNVRISALKIQDEGRKVSIEFDIPIYTERPPQKWVDLGYNTVFVEIDFFDISDISLKSVGNKFIGDIEIDEVESGLIIINISGSVIASITADVGMIQSVRGYINS
ncbi:hypothetical protein H1230_12515 [Paenibacillus sp. 19GGS1-52]|uniref:Imm50 family immunity protein n=1 Tax=Paenibacillus sp. 19GGS1-52 TaxID=2758563 RepID=UPI001EFA722E|nr:Imm50 family immunity protein [Paenibacillus sp. 19GGS1-52]ULO09519.1 hypothetical protein H1230_12515 [Paenibacillus sp. 19GGS1-52]